jgi:hypothetical protein
MCICYSLFNYTHYIERAYENQPKTDSLQKEFHFVMINKKPTRNYATLKSLIILPVVAILFVMFSFKPESTLRNTGNQKPLFSKTSESEILGFLAKNTGYPQEARSSSDTGKVFVVVKMNMGGVYLSSLALAHALTLFYVGPAGIEPATR